MPSQRLKILVAAIHIFVVILIWFSALPLWFCTLCDLAIVGHWFFCSHRYFDLGERSLVFIDGAWSMIAQDKKISLELVGESFVTTFLIILKFKTEQGKSFYLHLLNDNVSQDDLRRLRVCLKYA